MPKKLLSLQDGRGWIIMEENKIILYIHGMGGGGDSRIPSVLNEKLPEHWDTLSGPCPEVIVRTYSFDPETAERQIAAWVDELSPVLIIGESLGSLNAIKIKGLPHLLVSPSLNAPIYFGYFAFLSLIPGVTGLLDRIFRPREGDRQSLHFNFKTLRKYRTLRIKALGNSPKNGSSDLFYAFFGTKDHYRKSGIVCVRTYRRYFGGEFSVYDGTHFMEEEYIESLLVPKIIEVMDKNTDYR